MSIVNVFRQVAEDGKLFRLDIEYLGTESFTAGALKSIQEALVLYKNTKSLKYVSLKLPKDLFKEHFVRKFRESDLN